MGKTKVKVIRPEKPTNDAQRQKALELAMKRIEQDYGKGSIMRFSEKTSLDITVIPSGALSLDVALGVGGYPRGRIIEIYGPESSGKTTLALHAVASAQHLGGIAAFIDAEHAMDPTYSSHLGVNLDELLISQPDSGEQALSIAELLINSNAVDIIVIDSVAALVPRAEIEGDMGDSLPGLHARLMSQAMRKLTAAISRSKTTMIFINQIREKIGGYGNPETTTGGRALKFYSTIRVEVRRIGAIKDGTNNIGNTTRARVVKNKVAPPFRETQFDIMFGEGISTEGDLLDLAVEHDLVTKSGSWYSTVDGERLGQGREAIKRFLQDHPDLTASLDAQLRAILFNPAGAQARAPKAGEPTDPNEESE